MNYNTAKAKQDICNNIFNDNLIINDIDNTTSPNKKILILRIYSDNNTAYKLMKQTHEYYINNDNIFDTYFVSYKENITDDVIIENNDIYIKGSETYLGITKKTILALKHLCSLNNYDYIVRSNISTFIDYNNLLNYINTLPKTNVYTGGMILNLEWMYKKYIHTKFVSGTSIIMSNDICNRMIKNFNKGLISEKIVDDLSLGIYIRYNEHIAYKQINELYYKLLKTDNYINIQPNKNNFNNNGGHKFGVNHFIYLKSLNSIKCDNIFIRIRTYKDRMDEYKYIDMLYKRFFT